MNVYEMTEYGSNEAIKPTDIKQAVELVCKGSPDYYGNGQDRLNTQIEATTKFVSELVALLCEHERISPAELQALLGSGWKVRK